MTTQHIELTRSALIVTALSVEYAAVRGHLTDIVEDEHPQGDIYERGIFQAAGQRWQVGIVEMGMGNPNAAQKSERAIAHFQPEAVLFVGVAGGIKDAKIGDVVVASKVYGYHFGKAAEDFKTRPEVGLPGHRLLERARAEARKPDWLKRLPETPPPVPKVFLGAIAAGEQVVTSTQSASYQLIRNSYNDALALEMESYGFFKAAQAHSGLEALAVRGISDLLEGKADADQGGSQERASQHAAAFAFEVLAKLKLPEKNLRVEVREVVREVPAPSTPHRSNLPHQQFFFGRTKELASIAEAISPEARTWGALIDGPGGIGKTALAVRAGYLAPVEHFERKIFLSAKVRDLRPSGEQPLDDFLLPDYLSLLSELAHEVSAEDAAQANPEERIRAVQRALSGKRILLVIDNVETWSKAERDRLYQFLSRLPDGCKAIVTSRRRTDIDARIIRLDHLDKEAALELLAVLAEDNPHVRKARVQERINLYESTEGNPLLIRWTVGQLGRTGSHCRTIAEACAFLHAAPKGNDPLEYIFGDLLDTLTPSETAVLAALALFTHPAPVEQIAAVAGLAEQAARTALDDLNDRALLLGGNAEDEKFLLPKLAAVFIRRQRPKVVAKSSERLTDRAYALALENGYQKYERFPKLEYEWPLLAAALPLFVQGENNRLQTVCYALTTFFNFSGRWDELLALCQQAEEKALAAGDSNNAGRQAYYAGMSYCQRGHSTKVLECAARCTKYWVKAGARERAFAIRLRGIGHKLEKNYPAAVAAYREWLGLCQTIAPESMDVAIGLNDLATMERLQRDFSDAECNYNEALRIAKKVEYREGVALYTGNLAGLALEREDWPQAEEQAQQALALAEKIGRQELIAADCRIIAKALARQGKAAEGLEYARRAVDIFTHLRQPDELEKAQAALRECGG